MRTCATARQLSVLARGHHLHARVYTIHAAIEDQQPVALRMWMTLATTLKALTSLPGTEPGGDMPASHVDQRDGH